MKLSEQTKILQNFIKENKNISQISQIEISKTYQDLIDCIVDHNHLYYINSSPIISDFEYDELFDYLKKIEKYFPFLISGNSPSQKLVNQIQEGFQKAEHTNPMLSLENSYNAQDLLEREERLSKILQKAEILKKPTYYIEAKFDGLSIELIYQDGVFQKAITRGDGLVGEDVSENVKTIKNLKKTLNGNIKGKISFRGEIVISKSELNKINKERSVKGLQIYANTRNLASGSLKQLDPSITASRNLQCFVYEILYSEQNEIFKIAELGLATYPEILESKNINEIIKTCENPETKNNLEKKDIDFDGLVIKVKEEELRKIIGSTNHHPRRAIAYKFPAQQVSTQIKSIEFQVGRSGIITPVANVEVVNLSGANISRVSLHNFDFIKEKDIHHKDFVRIQRSGEVIPYIVSTIVDRREENSKKIEPPTNCPSCKTNLTQIDIHYFCQNPNCPAQTKEKIIRFVSKDCMDIEGIGDSIVDILVENNVIKNVADLYKLLDFETERIVRRFPGFADKKISEIKKQLEESKNKEFWRLLNALGIPGIGKKTAKDLSSALNDLFKGKQENINLNLISKYITDPEFLSSIYGIGEKIIQGIINYWNKNKSLLEQLEKIGLNFSPNTSIFSKENGVLETFSITGSFDIPRPKIIEEMEKNGYIFDSNPNKNTKYMLIGSKPGNKLAKAEELELEIINSREEITKKFPFLLEIKIEKTKSGPEQVGLF
ncbi:MAG: NAD-dependent DNA ligase LigA [Candidatus Absconditabacterales bacterium]|nr:NAD-dependent DNA ligase LigA [Candidatus Absconditabacterales bacterium]